MDETYFILKQHLIILLFHNEFHVVGLVYIKKRIHIIAFGHNACNNLSKQWV